MKILNLPACLFLLIFALMEPAILAQERQGTYSLPKDQVVAGRPWTRYIPDPDKFDWSSGKEGRPGYRYRGMLPVQQRFYDYVQEKRRSKIELTLAERATIQWLISSRRWPEVPKPDPYWAAFMRYLRNQPTLDLNVAQSLMFNRLRALGLVPVDPPPNANMERLRDYLNSQEFRPRNWFERTFGRVEPWIDNMSAAKGLDLSSNTAAYGNSFPSSGSFNGLKVSYTISGATLGEPTDSEGFTIRRRYSGVLGTGTLSVSGTASTSMGFGTDVTIKLWAGDKSKEEKFYIVNPDKGGNSRTFNLTVPIPAGARTGGFAINLDGRYSMGGGHRGCYVSGSFGPSQAQLDADRAAADAKWRKEVEDTLKRLGYQNTPEGKEVEEIRKALAGGDAAWKTFVNDRLDRMKGDSSPQVSQYKELESAMENGGKEWEEYVATYGGRQSGVKKASASKTDPQPKPTPSSTVRPPTFPALNIAGWFTHGSRSFRLPLFSGWTTQSDDSDADNDMIISDDDELVIWVQRNSTKIASGKEGDALNRAARSLASKYSGARVVSTLVGTSPAMLVTAYDSSEKQPRWFYFFVNSGRIFSLYAMMPPGTGNVAVPKQLVQFLQRVEILRNSTSSMMPSQTGAKEKAVNLGILRE